MQTMIAFSRISLKMPVATFPTSPFGSFIPWQFSARGANTLSPSSYMREYQSLGTAGGLYHFRDTILKGNPDQIFVLHADIACTFVSSVSIVPTLLLLTLQNQPLEQLKAFHDKHRGVGTVMGVKVPKETATKYGCIVIDPETQQVRPFS